MRETENPAGGRGSVLGMKGFVCAESLLLRSSFAVKLWALRWLRTLTSEIGMNFSRWTDKLTIALDEVGK